MRLGAVFGESRTVLLGAVLAGAALVAVAFGLVLRQGEAPEAVPAVADGLSETAGETPDPERAERPDAGPVAAAPPAEPPPPEPPSFDQIRVARDGSAVIAGSAPPGAAVSLRLDGAEIGTAASTSAGQFAAILRLAPADAPRILSLAALMPGGAEIAGLETVIIAPFGMNELQAARAEIDAGGAELEEQAAARVTDDTAPDPAPRPAEDVASSGRSEAGAPPPDHADSAGASQAASTAWPEADERAPEEEPVAEASADPALAPPEPEEQAAPTEIAAADPAPSDIAPPDTPPADARPASTGPPAAPGTQAPGAPAVAVPAPGVPDPVPPVAYVPDPDAPPAAPPLPAAPESAAPALVVAGPDGLRVIRDGSTGPPDAQTTIRIDAISYDAEGAVTLSGVGTADRQVEVLLDNRPVETGEIGPGGRWSLELPDVDPGTYTLSVTQRAPGGDVESRVDTPFLREDPARIAASPMLVGPGVSVITVQPGFTLWGIAEANFGQGISYVQIFEENVDQIRDPDLIFPGQIFQLPDLPRGGATP